MEHLIDTITERADRWLRMSDEEQVAELARTCDRRPDVVARIEADAEARREREGLAYETTPRGCPVARRNAEDAAGAAMGCNDHDGLG